MTKTNTQIARKPWARPVVQKIAAGQAEVGSTPTGGDGQFTLS
jgi:hypothetical protein